MNTLKVTAFALTAAVLATPAIADDFIRDGSGAPIKQMYTSNTNGESSKVNCVSGEHIRDGVGNPVCQVYTDSSGNVVAGDFHLDAFIEG